MDKLSTFQIVLLAVFGAFGFAGILIFALVTASGNASSVGPVVIWGTFDDAEIKTILREAADNDPRFSEVTYVKKDAADYDANIKDALASGKGPDLFIMREDRAVRDSGYALHISYDQISRSQFNDSFIEAAAPFLAKDGIIAVPLVVDPLVLFWNKDALSSAGIADPPKYWDELPSMTQLLVKKDDAGAIQKGGIALGNFDNIPGAKDILTTLIMQAGGAITGYDSTGALRPQLATQGGSQLAVTALSFYTEFANPLQPDYSWSKAFKDSRSAFVAGDVAMYIGHASEIVKINAANPNLNFGMVALPQIRSATYKLDSSHVYGLALSRTSKNAAGALTIASLVASPEISLPIAKSLGMTSPLRRVLSQIISPSASSTAQSSSYTRALQGLVAGTERTGETLLAYEANISRSWNDPDPDKTDAIFRDMIENTVSGALKASEAVQRADKQIADLLGI